MKAVETGSLINQAALDHGMPPTTLKDRLSGRVKHGDKPGPKQYLNSEGETELATFLKTFVSVGYCSVCSCSSCSVCGHGQGHSKGTQDQSGLVASIPRGRRIFLLDAVITVLRFE